MRKNVFDVELLIFETNYCNQPVVIPFDVEYDKPLDPVGVTKCRLDIGEILPLKLLDSAAPLLQWSLSLLVLLKESSSSSPMNDLH